MHCVAVIMTSSPSNEAELQLYRVMQRASLLAYYDTLLEMGKTDTYINTYGKAVHRKKNNQFHTKYNNWSRHKLYT